MKRTSEGRHLKNCPCDLVCPRNYLSKPTHTNYASMVALEIEERHFGDTSIHSIKFTEPNARPLSRALSSEFCD